MPDRTGRAGGRPHRPRRGVAGTRHRGRRPGLARSAARAGPGRGGRLDGRASSAGRATSRRRGRAPEPGSCGGARVHDAPSIDDEVAATSWAAMTLPVERRRTPATRWPRARRRRRDRHPRPWAPVRRGPRRRRRSDRSAATPVAPRQRVEGGHRRATGQQDLAEADGRRLAQVVRAGLERQPEERDPHAGSGPAERTFDAVDAATRPGCTFEGQMASMSGAATPWPRASRGRARACEGKQEPPKPGPGRQEAPADAPVEAHAVDDRGARQRRSPRQAARARWRT